MGSASRSRSLTVTADGSTNQTGWMAARSGIVITIEVPGTMTGTVTLQRRGKDGVIVDVTDNSGTVITYTKAGVYTYSPTVAGDFRLNCKSGAFGAGPWTQMIEGR